jgi:predicted transcriptional regulator
MRVLLSIKPEFASKIFNGSKKYEYRRAIHKRSDVERVLVYASAPISKVIGEFEIAGILHDDPKQLWNQTNSHAGISKQIFFKYFSNISKGYAIEVKNHVFYETPVSLASLSISSPPQSFMYLQ